MGLILFLIIHQKLNMRRPDVKDLPGYDFKILKPYLKMTLINEVWKYWGKVRRQPALFMQTVESESIVICQNRNTPITF